MPSDNFTMSENSGSFGMQQRQDRFDAIGDLIVGPPGPPGPQGPPGADGTVSFDELTPAQRESLRGEDGVSPAVSFTTITGGHTMTVTDKDHPEGQSINIMDGSGGGGTSNYNDLSNKPSINGNTLSGNKTAAQLGLGTYTKPSSGIPASDLASTVQTSLGLADSALQSVPSTYRTAAAQDSIDAAQDAEIGIVITGKRPSMAVTAGQFVIVRNSTISGISDGLYTANAALSPSTDVTASNLTAVSGGGLNNFASYYDNYNNPTLTTPSEAGITVNSSVVRRKGNLVILYVNVRNTNGFPAETWTTIHTLNVRPDATLSASCAFQGQTATLRLNTDGTVQIYPHGSAFSLFARVIIPFFI